MPSPLLVVFGSQLTTKPTEGDLSRVHQCLANGSYLPSLLKAIEDLPNLYNELTKHNSRFQLDSAAQSAANLKAWVESGRDLPSFEGLPNSFLTPFTVLTHVALFSELAASQSLLTPSSSSVSSPSAKKYSLSDVQGFCTGFLAASALAFASDNEQFDSFAATAIRLAFLAGVAVDVDANDSSPTEGAGCLVVRLPDDSSLSSLNQLLSNFPETYISVISQVNVVTLTVPDGSLRDVSNSLTQNGYVTRDFGLRGRFHSPSLENILAQLLRFCDEHNDLQLPSAENLSLPLRSNVDGSLISEGRLDRLALQSLLTATADWHSTISSAAVKHAASDNAKAVAIGHPSCLPQSLVNRLGLEILAPTIPHQSQLPDVAASLISPIYTPESSTMEQDEDVVFSRYPANAIAVTGMACKFPGADSPEELWELFSSGKSMVEEVPASRFDTQGLRRSKAAKSRFFGNFVRDPDAFDHRFFGKSSREASQMDPQQRLLLEVAYQAMESTGTFTKAKVKHEDTGCYVGVCASDYNDNVASHPPTAFSSLGTLRAFLSGKISHFFGWTGPSVTYDTACSSSAVAIDAACKAILVGDCSQAIAGGVNLITSANFYQNLAAASFLSPTGATKSFDASADGYCRGEGVGLVVLKRLSTALEEGDNILGVIAATAVNQNSNAAPITVPCSASQQTLYERIAQQANVDPTQVTYVEAHGTGTPVGDPIECESIRNVFGGPTRDQTLYIGSLKANIGHTESASGVAGLLKVLLMMRHRSIPPQANFTALNPKIPPLQPNNMAIATSVKKWDTNFMMACVNNYGAAGSNAAMLVCEPPVTKTIPVLDSQTSASKPSGVPIFITANSVQSMLAFCQKLLESIQRASPIPHEATALDNLAQSLNRRRNIRHAFSCVFTVSTFEDLKNELKRRINENQAISTKDMITQRPTVLVFGGQTGSSVGLSFSLYNSSNILRTHLADCDAVIRSLGLTSIFPGIFQTETVENVVELHCQLFAAQYSCARSWIDCGLKVDAVLGHSFGQLTSLCISGSLSLEDGLKLVSGRAQLMQQFWGPERGSMISIEADEKSVLDLCSSMKSADGQFSAEIACYNGPKNHVLVGTQSSIDAVESLLSAKKASSEISRWKRLNVPYGFHSVFTEPLLPGLLDLTRQLKFEKPHLFLETCSDAQTWDSVTAELVCDHTRSPVYFSQAVSRLESRFGPCTWIEAGFNSSVVSLVRRSLQSADDHKTYPFNVMEANALDNLATSTAGIWTSNPEVTFWPFHNRIQDPSQSLIESPPYQFDTARHWLDWIDYANVPSVPEPMLESSKSQAPASFMTIMSQSESGAQILFDPTFEDYRLYVQGHRVLDNPLCPAPLYVELALRGVQIASNTQGEMIHSIENLEIKAPLGLAEDRYLLLNVEQAEGSETDWAFTFTSSERHSLDTEASEVLSHASGLIRIAKADNNASTAEYNRYRRLVSYDRIQQLTDPGEGDAMHGSLIYKVFSRVCNYEPYYKGVRTITAKGNEAVARIELPASAAEKSSNSDLPALLFDNFMQVAGLHMNSMTECKDTDVFVCTMVERLQTAKNFSGGNLSRRSWTVYSTSNHMDNKRVMNDIFVFDNETQELAAYLLGVLFTRVPINSLARVLSSADGNMSRRASTHGNMSRRASTQSNTTITSPQRAPATVTFSNVPKASPRESPRQSPQVDDLFIQIRTLVAKITEVEASEITSDVGLDALGIDSLMITEVLSEVNEAFGAQISLEEFAGMPNLDALCEHLKPQIKRSVSRVSLTETSRSPSDMSRSSSFGSASTTSSRATAVEMYQDENNSAGSKDDCRMQLAELLREHLDTELTIEDEANLADAGLDSLICMEFVADIEKIFGVTIDANTLTNETTFQDILRMISKSSVAPSKPKASTKPCEEIASPPVTSTHKQSPRSEIPTGNQKPFILNAPDAFLEIRGSYDSHATRTGFSGFWQNVYPSQSQLVLAYVVEAFDTIGISLAALKAGSKVPRPEVLPRNELLLSQMFNILEDASVVQIRDKEAFRTSLTLNIPKAQGLKEKIVKDFPLHAKEHELLHLTGSKLGQCLQGTDDALKILFGSAQNRKLLQDVYTTGPMYEAVTSQLASFFEKALNAQIDGEVFEILEIGGGTGGTTAYLTEHLTSLGVPFKYTFTDISSSLVGAAKRKFGKNERLSFTVLDVEKEPPTQHIGKYHAILSTNCVHATRNLQVSGTNILKMLRPDGFLSLVEFTRNMFWFDLVFGLLDGWWNFEDGRPHVLATEYFWDRSLRNAGFKKVMWTGADTEESNTLRIITAFRAEVETSVEQQSTGDRSREEETILVKQVGSLSLFADISYPKLGVEKNVRRPIALMVHGGGHIMLSRRDVRPKQTQKLLEMGFLPISIDYRLCPEVDIQSGAMVDMCDAVQWARHQLSTSRRHRHDVLIDSERVVVVGWSTGGTLAMTSAWTTVDRGLNPPDAILAFYCPTDYEDECWKVPNYPGDSLKQSQSSYDLLEGIFEQAVTAYNVPTKTAATGGWMAPSDPRSRLVLHNNWQGQVLPTILDGIPTRMRATADPLFVESAAPIRPQPSLERIKAISPLAQIRNGRYTVPTFLVCAGNDDLIPVDQIRRTHSALEERGVKDSKLVIVEDAPHLFDLYRQWNKGQAAEAVQEGLSWLAQQAGLLS